MCWPRIILPGQTTACRSRPVSGFGPYEVLRRIGAGGMGEVYRARDPRLERTVAIKLLSEEFAANPDRRARFEREARAIASLNHPHICALHDVGACPDPRTGDPLLFLVMEYIEGQTLAERLSSGPLPASDVVRYAAELADALAHAHRRGIVHRDLKPGNVMLTKAGTKLLDFGLSKLQPSAGLTGLSTASSGNELLTSAGTMLGTYPYMAPEQLAGQEADARSDIFALGAIIHEMATGRRAFDGTTAPMVIGAVLHANPPPVSTLQPQAPAGLDRIVARSLAKDPENRWQSAQDLALDLRWIVEQPASPATESRSRYTRTPVLIGSAFLLISFVAATAGLMYQRSGLAEDVSVPVDVFTTSGLDSR